MKCIQIDNKIVNLDAVTHCIVDKTREVEGKVLVTIYFGNSVQAVTGDAAVKLLEMLNPEKLQ